MDTYSANEIIELAVQIERNGYHFYQEALKQPNLDKETEELLKYLSEQEIEHEKTFIKMRNEEEELELDESHNWEEVAQFLKTIIDSRIFSDEKSAIAQAKASKTREELLRHALQFEKDTLLYFHSIHSLAKDGRIKEILENIIVEEMSHIVKLALFLDKK